MEKNTFAFAEKVKKKIFENFFGYLKFFTPIQSDFLSNLYQRYHCLDSGNIVLFFAKKTHQSILRNKDYDLNYDLSFEKFWHNHDKSHVENSTIIEVAKKLNLPKETTRRKLSELIKQKIFIKKNKNISWLPSDEYKKSYNEVVSAETKQLAKLTKYVTDKIGLNFSHEEIENEYQKKFSFYWFHYLDLQLKWIKLWKEKFGDLEIVMIFMQIATLLSSRVKEDVSHDKLFSEPDIVIKPKVKNINVSISATSLSDVTGIPRATCIRKLNQMASLKMITQDENSKRYYIIPEALNKSLVSKDLTEKATELFSEFYIIVIKALSSKTSH